LTSSFLVGLDSNPAVSSEVSQQAQVELTAGVPFVSDADLEEALEQEGMSGAEATAIVDENAQARIEALRASLSVLAVIALLALFFARGLPTVQPGSEGGTSDAGSGDEDDEDDEDHLSSPRAQ
jgi:hypothetical protein